NTENGIGMRALNNLSTCDARGKSGGWGSEIEDSRFKIQKDLRFKNKREKPGFGAGRYSSTKMFFLAQISFRIFGQTVTLTSPRCALRSNNIRVRDWPIPPPIDRGIWWVKIPWW